VQAEERALVKNAADEKQVKEGAKREKSHRDREIDDIRQVMSSPQGRRFIWRLLGHCGVYESIWEASAKIHYNAGKQDVGHFLLAEVVQANEELYSLMIKESKKEF
jgi:hypothetical protein